MADNEMMGLTYLVLAIYMIDLVTSFNIDTKTPYIYNGVKGSYFGYSVAFNLDTQGIIVGAPFSNDTNEGTKPWGSVFNCVYSGESSERRCKKLHKVNTLKLGYEKKDNQMMGATVYSDHYRTMACAPRYKTRNTAGNGTTVRYYMPGKCEVIYPDYTADEDWVWRPCETKISNDAAFRYCQTGFSAKIQKNKRMIGGCPSYNTSRGALAFHERFTNTFTNTNFADNVDDYRGYAIGSGKLSTGNVESLIGGAPRANLLTGGVNVYKQMQTGFSISYHASDPSNQPGSYFGSAFAVANIDGDESNLDDLVIGAPYYSSGQLPNEGAVYVYLNSGDGMVLKQKLFGDKEKNACFGYSIVSVGDLNKDKRSDIAVGAPWGGPEGRGMVFIYYGTKSQEDPLILKQTLSPSILGGNAAQLNGFGYSFAEYYPYKVQDLPADHILNDVDQNKYPDLGIGAYRSDSVVILRSRPVVTVTGTLSIINTEGAKIQKIDLLDVSSASVCKAPDEKTYKCLKVEVGFELSGSGIGSTDVKYTLDVDSGQRKKRAFFLLRKGKTRTTTHNDVMNVAKVKKIDTLTVYLINDTKDVVHEMKITLKWVLKDQSSCGKNKICPVLNQMEAVSTFKELPYIKGCSSDGNDECNADLVLTMTKSLTTIQSGLTKTIDIYIEIQNNGENAYINKLYIEYSSGIQPETVRITNHPGAVIWNIGRDRKNVAEVILSNPIRQNTKEKVRIVFGLSSMKTSLKQVSWKAQVHTESTEMKPGDNKASISIDVVLVANLTITGNAAPEQLKWKKGVTSSSVPGQRIVHTFLLQNKGPSAVDDSDLEIRFPEKINGHYILNIINVKLDGSRKSQVDPAVCDVGKFNPLKISGLDTARTAKSSNNITRSGRRRREVSQGLNCGDKSVECRIIKCKLNDLKKLDDVTVTITSTLVEATFETHIKVNKKIGVYAKFASKKVSKPAKDAAKDNIEVYFTVVTPYGTMTAESKPLAWWIILICVLAALLIIIIVAYILYKKKFFERNRPPAEEEETLKNGDLEADEY